MRARRIVRSFVSNDLPSFVRIGDFDEAVANGYVATHGDGEPYLIPSPFLATADAAVIDFTKPDAWDWWKAQVEEMLELGADGFMDDFGEQLEPHMQFFDGSTGVTMHNRTSALQHQATREAVDEFLADNPGREVFFFSRAGYSGRPGAAAFGQTSMSPLLLPRRSVGSESDSGEHPHKRSLRIYAEGV